MKKKSARRQGHVRHKKRYGHVRHVRHVKIKARKPHKK